MKIAVLSDIHGNYIALQTCLEYALKRGIKTFFFLGDYLGELHESGLIFLKSIGSRQLKK